MTTIIIASTKPKKIKATREILKKLFPDCILEVSGISMVHSSDAVSLSRRAHLI